MRAIASDPTHAGVSSYLEYLDKEMTIMGILTAFAGATPAIVLDRTIGAKDSTPAVALWESYSSLILLGSGALFLSALYFYRQRSLLAYYVGQISLCLTPANYRDKTLSQWIAEADLWSAWNHYATAFALVAIGFVYYSLTLLLSLRSNAMQLTWIHQAGPAVIILSCLFVRRLVFHKYRDEYDPWHALWLAVTKSKSIKSTGG